MDLLEKNYRDFMKSKGSEVRLLMKILAIFGFLIILLLLAVYIYLRIKSPDKPDFTKDKAGFISEVRSGGQAEAFPVS